jgi:hypothetical protein
MAAPVQKNRAILLRFPGFAYHFAKYHLQCGEIPHCPTLICLIPGLFFDTLPAQLISGMNRQLLEEDPLCQKVFLANKDINCWLISCIADF